MKLNVALIQYHPVLCEIDENISRINGLIDRTGPTSLIVLPELASTGYNFSSLEEAYACSEEPGSSRFVEFLIRKAREKNACIVAGINERQQDKQYNSSVLVEPGGSLSIYRKTHLFMNEKDIFQKGDGNMPVVDIGGVRIGMLICFDYLFPEIWRMQAMQGADVICHPSNLLTQNAHRCIPALALMNHVYILTVNRVGKEGDLAFNGQSFITDPSGEVLVKASEDMEDTIEYTLDMVHSRNKWVTERNHVFEDRRPDVYK